uniref:Uncharacterized protein n=1 Tax=Glossina pallidipes TaxID=7398 RepID=A0A1A9ZTM3_GLOPL
MQKDMSTKFLILIVLCCGKLNLAQLSLHTDANANSYLLKTPNLQQSVTRYYGGGQRAGLQQAHQQQQIDQQQQQPQSPIEQETQQRTQQVNCTYIYLHSDDSDKEAEEVSNKDENSEEIAHSSSSFIQILT